MQAGIPVIDGGNLAQNIMTAIESVAQTLNETCDTGGNAKVRVYLHTESGKTLFDKSYTE